MWSSLAASAGHPQAALLRDALAQELPPAIIASAQEDAAFYVRGNTAGGGTPEGQD